MAYRPKILAFAGSLRKDSYNKKLVKLAIRGAEQAGADVTFLDLSDLPLPVYDGDIEATKGLPQNAILLKKLLIEHDGFLISSPEYNSSISGCLKNAIDWASRPQAPEEKNLICFNGKTAVLMSASLGGLGGLRGLVHVRAILENMGVLVLPEQKTIPSAMDAFNPDQTLKDPKQQAAIEKLGQNLAAMLKKLH